MTKKIISWLFSVLAALILLQTLFFKFSASPESVAIFSQLGVEPWGRIVTGIFELIASILILVPKTRLFGAIMAIGLMAGALGAHIFVIGIESQGDGGYLFLLAITVLIAALIVLMIHRLQLQELIARLSTKK